MTVCTVPGTTRRKISLYLFLVYCGTSLGTKELTGIIFLLYCPEQMQGHLWETLHRHLLPNLLAECLAHAFCWGLAHSEPADLGPGLRAHFANLTLKTLKPSCSLASLDLAACLSLTPQRASKAHNKQSE